MIKQILDDCQVVEKKPFQFQMPSKLEFGNLNHIKLVEFSEKYNIGKAKYPMQFEGGGNLYKLMFPCAECTLKNYRDLPDTAFRKKNVLDTTKKRRLAKYLKTQNALSCTRCGCHHRLDLKNFSIIKSKSNKNESIKESMPIMSLLC